MGEKLTPMQLDRAVLRELAGWHYSPTYAIRNGIDRHLPTRKILQSCRRLEARGHAAIDRKASGWLNCWGITPAGRAALQAEEGRG